MQYVVLGCRWVGWLMMVVVVGVGGVGCVAGAWCACLCGFAMTMVTCAGRRYIIIYHPPRHTWTVPSHVVPPPLALPCHPHPSIILNQRIMRHQQCCWVLSGGLLRTHMLLLVL